MNPTRVEAIALSGGLNVADPPLALKGGELVVVENFELSTDTVGYRRIDGYERYDGRAAPSATVLRKLAVSSLAAPAAGDTVSTAGGASGKVAYSDATNLVLFDVSGTFNVGDAVTGPGGAVGTVSAVIVPFLRDETGYATAYRYAAGQRRTAIAAVPGSGPVRGVAASKGQVYAWRDSTDGTSMGLFKASATGWQSVALGGFIRFKNGLSVIKEGQTVTGATSTATAKVERVIVTSGDWSAPMPASGRLVLSGITGTFADTEDLKVGTTVVAKADALKTLPFTTGKAEFMPGATLVGATSAATGRVVSVTVTSGSWAGKDAAGTVVLSGVTGTFNGTEDLKVGNDIVAKQSAAITVSAVYEAHALKPGGNVRTLRYNFYGADNKIRLYGCDSVNPAFEFDGTVFAQIVTGMGDDRPTLIAEHKSHLFLAYKGGSLQNSSLNEPLTWQVRTGAAELAVGADITALVSFKGETLIVFAKEATFALYGKTSATFSLETVSKESGTQYGLAREIAGGVFVVNDMGLAALSATQNYGDFDLPTVSRKVKPLLKAADVRVLHTVKNKTQLRLIMNDNTAIVATFSGTDVAFMRSRYLHAFVCVGSGDDAAGAEWIFMGGDDGFVYQMDKGPSFDGQAIVSTIRTAFFTFKGYSLKKRLHKVALDIGARHPIKLQIMPDFNYGTTSTDAYDLSGSGGGGYYDTALWDEVYYDAALATTAEANISGVGTNMSFLLVHESDLDQPFSLNALIVHFSNLGLQR